MVELRIALSREALCLHRLCFPILRPQEGLGFRVWLGFRV